MALFVCLQALAADHDFSLHAVHLEHGIRGDESRRDAEFVTDMCRKAGVPLHLQHVDVPARAAEEKIGLELAARRERYDFFQQLCDQGVVDTVATAHHMEDNAESLLLHMVRGAGLEGLAGMQPRTGQIVRPFLCVHRQEIRDYLRAKDVPWVEDSSNEDTGYRRNYIRRELLPRLEQVNPQAVEALNRLARSASADLEFLTEEAEATAQRAALYNGEDRAEIDIAVLNAVHEAMAVRVLRQVLRHIGRLQDLSSVQLQALLRLARNGRSGSSLSLGGGLHAEIRYGRLRLGPESVPDAAHWEYLLGADGLTPTPLGTLACSPADKRGRAGPWSQYVDAAKLPPGTVVRTRRPGDVFYPLGAPGKKKLKDYFIDMKLPREERVRVPLLADGSRILWVIGCRLSQDVAVTAQTQRILHLSFRKDQQT